MTRQPSLGACPDEFGTSFRVWAPTVHLIEVVHGPTNESQPLVKGADGYFTGHLRKVGVGTLYRFRVDGQGPFPDPASRYQPQGVHGPSQVVAPNRFPWTDAGWSGYSRDQLIFYELHVGTFSPEGTFAGVTRRLEWLRDLGVTAIELMPIADFPGERNWGYDGVSLFAPARCYGTPEDLQHLVNTAHQLGLSVFLDVVYNHLGPDGNYTGIYSPYYLSKTHKNPWGDCVNVDGPHNAEVRSFFIENALYWLREFHIDGLRLDATHALIDESPQPFLAELAAKVHEAFPDRTRWLIAEDHRNLASMVKPASAGGLGLDGVWADDFHHEMRRFLARDKEGYYRDYRGSVADLATILNRGWLYCGEFSTHLAHNRGSDPAGLDPSQFVICIQNHDQIGNRAFGERLSHQITPAAYRAASAVLLSAPQTPLLFMGQEWSASTPFRFFADHNAELGPLVTAGRRDEFRHFSAFSDPKIRETIPDPQAPNTFRASQLNWTEIDQPEHVGTLRLYSQLLQLRRARLSCRAFQAIAIDESTLVLRIVPTNSPPLLLIAKLAGSGRFTATDHPIYRSTGGWELVLNTEEARFALEPNPPELETDSSRLIIDFPAPAAVLFIGRNR